MDGHVEAASLPWIAMERSSKIRAAWKVFTFFLTFAFVLTFELALSQSDKGKEGRGREEQLEKQEEKEEKKKEKIEEAKEKHKEMQSKRTKREMRQLNRKSGRWNKGRREFFLVRWYKRIRYEFRKNGGP